MLANTFESFTLILRGCNMSEGVERDDDHIELLRKVQLTNIHLVDVCLQSLLHELLLQKRIRCSGEIHAGQFDARLQQRDRDPARTRHQFQDLARRFLRFVEEEINVKGGWDIDVIQAGDGIVVIGFHVKTPRSCKYIRIAPVLLYNFAYVTGSYSCFCGGFGDYLFDPFLRRLRLCPAAGGAQPAEPDRVRVAAPGRQFYSALCQNLSAPRWDHGVLRADRIDAAPADLVCTDPDRVCSDLLGA